MPPTRPPPRCCIHRARHDRIVAGVGGRRWPCGIGHRARHAGHTSWWHGKLGALSIALALFWSASAVAAAFNPSSRLAVAQAWRVGSGGWGMLVGGAAVFRSCLEGGRGVTPRHHLPDFHLLAERWPPSISISRRCADRGARSPSLTCALRSAALLAVWWLGVSWGGMDCWAPPASCHHRAGREQSKASRKGDLKVTPSG